MELVHTAVEKLNLNLIWPDKRVVILGALHVAGRFWVDWMAIASAASEPALCPVRHVFEEKEAG